MKTVTLTLTGVLLATSAMIAPGLAFAQTAPASQSPTAQTPAVEAEPDTDETQLDEVVVLGRFIPTPNRESPEVAAFLTAEDLERTGDADAAQALARVTGLTIVEGRFIYVRGLGERYSSALLNGSPLPSPEPLQRVIPLDLFPADVLSGLTVQKTYSVSFPGEFGGGVIDLQTLATPTDPFFSMKASIGANSETTGQDGLIYFGSRTDFTGFDDGTRDIPGALQLAFNSGRRIQAGPDYTTTRLNTIGQSLINAPLRLVQQDETPVNFGFGFTGGTSTETPFGTAGAVFVAGYDNSWSGREGVRQTGRLDAGRLVVGDDFTFRSNQNDISLNFLGGLSLTNENNEFKWTNFFVRNVTKEARSTQGIQDGAGFRRNDNTEWFERQLFSSQLTGDHSLGEAWDFKWRVAYANTTRDAPYETNFAYGRSATGIIQHQLPSSRIRFSAVDDTVVSGGADLSYTVPLSDLRDIVFTVGVASSDNDRSSEERSLGFIELVPLTPSQLQSRVDFLTADVNIGPYLQIVEFTGSNGASAYDANLRVNAAYAQVEWDVLPLVSLNMGVRYEDGEQQVRPFDLLTGGGGFAATQINEQYVLPAGTVTWNFYEDMQLRLGASKTIGRPQFRELAAQQYRDPESDRAFVGNPYLTDTEILNIDARYEWYFARQQYLTAGVFYKKLDRPIEATVTDQGSVIIQSFLNAPVAVITGFEVEAKKYFEFPDNGMSFIANKRWLVQANYTYASSDVQVGTGDTVPAPGTGVPAPAANFFVDGSRLQGQSDHVANLQLGWEDDTDRSQATLIANFVSERTSARATAGNPDFIQEPGVFLDFVYRKDFTSMGRELGFSLELRNLLGTSYDEYQQLGSDRVQVNGYDLGRSASVGLTARF